MKYEIVKEKVLKVAEGNATFQKTKITRSQDAVDYIRQFYFDDLEIYESFFILMLNRNNETIAFAKIAQGGVSGATVDIKIILKYAIDTLCSSVILAHNHPSGSIYPSESDIFITKKIINGTKLLDIIVFDHVILTKNSYYSFADNGNL